MTVWFVRVVDRGFEFTTVVATRELAIALCNKYDADFHKAAVEYVVIDREESLY
jgi:hypothetical protein